MSMDYGYYLNEFGGDLIPEGEFSRVFEEARRILLSLLFPLREEDFSAQDEAIFRRALCYQGEYIFSGKSAEVGVKSEKAGDYSVVYREPDVKKAISVFGAEVSPAAAHLLLASGLLLRWV